jgi:hypothetical protein
MTDKTTAVAIPEYLKAFMASQGANAEADSLASSSISIPRVSLRGRKFRLVEGGEEIRKPSDELNAVILAVEPGAGLFIKTFYEGTYNSGDSSPPTCASSDGIAPDGWVTTPQAQRCQTCPKNQFGSATSRSGKKSKACRDSKRVWLALPEDIDGTVFAMGIPVTSLKNVSEYGRELKTNGYPISAVITQITMEDSEFPMLEFEMLGFLDEKTGKSALDRNIARDWNIGSASAAPLLEDAREKPKALPSVKEATQTVDATIADTKSTSNKGVDDVLGKW